jgi:hypothetical protein
VTSLSVKRIFSFNFDDIFFKYLTSILRILLGFQTVIFTYGTKGAKHGIVIEKKIAEVIFFFTSNFC